MSLPKLGSYFLAVVVFSFFAATIAHPQEAEPKEEGEEKAAAAGMGDASKGEEIFQQNCEFCHDANSNEVRVGPGMKGVLKELPESHTMMDGTEHTEHTVELVRKQIEEGGGGMMAMKDILSKEEIDHLIAYLKTL